jgi:hypothetical protein
VWLEEDDMSFELQKLRPLLRRRSDDEGVVSLIGQDPSIIRRNEYYGSTEFRDLGVDLVFKEAPWVIPPKEITDPMALYVSGFHFHRQGHEGFNEYLGRFPANVEFNDSEADVRRKLGQPVNTGGGGFSNVLGKPIPRWLSYAIDDALIHFQLDVDGKLEMVTLFAEAPQAEKRRRVGD